MRAWSRIRGRLFALVLLLTVGLALLPISAAAAPAISLGPNGGAVGDFFRVYGSGWPLGMPVSITFNGQQIASGVTPNAPDGSWQFPYHVPWVPHTGDYSVVATAGTGRAQQNYHVYSTQVQKPAPPREVTVASYGAYTIKVHWKVVSGNETFFLIRNGVETRTVRASGGAPDTLAEFQWGGLQPQTYMCFEVAARNSAGDSNWVPLGSWACTWSAQARPPKPPTNVVATAVNSSTIRITWWDNADNETAFGIYNGVTEQWMVQDNPQNNGTSYLWTGLGPHTYMCFRVQTYNENGKSDFAPTNGWACTSSTW